MRLGLEVNNLVSGLFSVTVGLDGSDGVLVCLRSAGRSGRSSVNGGCAGGLSGRSDGTADGSLGDTEGHGDNGGNGRFGTVNLHGNTDGFTT